MQKETTSLLYNKTAQPPAPMLGYLRAPRYVKDTSAPNQYANGCARTNVSFSTSISSQMLRHRTSLPDSDPQDDYRQAQQIEKAVANAAAGVYPIRDINCFPKNKLCDFCRESCSVVFANRSDGSVYCLDCLENKCVEIQPSTLLEVDMYLPFGQIDSFAMEIECVITSLCLFPTHSRVCRCQQSAAPVVCMGAGGF